MVAVIFISLAILLVIGIPISFALALTMLIYLIVKNDPAFFPMIAQQLYEGMDLYLLLAIPFLIGLFRGEERRKFFAELRDYAWGPARIVEILLGMTVGLLPNLVLFSLTHRSFYAGLQKLLGHLHVFFWAYGILGLPLAFAVLTGSHFPPSLRGWVLAGFGLLVLALLGHFHLPRRRVLIYLWNPLIIVEFAHGAHVDAFMIGLMMAALWALFRSRSRLLSMTALAAATLTKGLPALLLPVVVRRWGWRRTIVYAGLVFAICLPFALGAGWGLTGPLDGEGLFGALRIYAAHWNYNSSVYHWLEVWLSGYRTPEAVPLEVVGWGPIRAAKLTIAVALSMVLIAVWRISQRYDDDLALLQLTVVPLAAYLLLATTVHPWYVTLIIPLLPFLPPRKGGSGTVAPQATRTARFLLPWLYFSAAVSLSYLTYLDPANLREYDLVRLVEYVPLYLLLVWSAWPASSAADGPGVD